MAVNKVILLGNVGNPPEVRTLDSGIKVAQVSIATTERAYKMLNGTEVPERTEWHNLVLWKGLAETVEKYVNKGDKLYVEGKIRSRSYEDKGGVKRYITEVYVDSLELLGSKPSQGNSAPPAPQPTSSQNDQFNDLPF